MWWSPGLVCAALYAVTIYLDTGRVDQWWCVVGGILIMGFVDAALGIKQVTRKNPRTKKVYEQDPAD